MELTKEQKDAVSRLDNGKILYGTVGTGKTLTSLVYYVERESPRDLYVITTAKKRDSLDWEGEAAKLHIGPSRDLTVHGTITVDSWNNIGKYVDVDGAFFILDEQRLVGHGEWVKAFFKIIKNNRWILLSGTPGDSWLDYAPVFIANGFYRNITHFKLEHVVYEPYVKFPKVRGYLGTRKLERLRNELLVEMHVKKHTKRFLNWIDVDHDRELFDLVWDKRWHPYEDRPIKDVAELWRVARRVVYSDPSRLEWVKKLMMCHPRLIIFYNFNYELEILRGLRDLNIDVYEWNGHRKDELPEGNSCVYLVQYVAGAEGWNCISTDGMVFYSLTYSYKNFEQAQGRIDRFNTPYTNLYYYAFLSNTIPDRAVKRSLENKENFNLNRWTIEQMLEV